MTLREALLRGRNRPRVLGGGSPTTFRGDGYEFAQLRGYLPGDDIRRIDWAATARSGELQTRVVLEDVSLVLAAICDRSPSMDAGRNRCLAQAAMEAVEGWFEAAQEEDRLALLTADAPVPTRPGRGTFSRDLALAALRVQSVSRFELSAALDLARAVLPTGAALLLVSDAFEHELCDDVRLLGIGVRYDATMLLARDPWQDGLPLHGFVRFRDLESGEILSRWIGAAERARYHEASEARELAIRRRFESAGWRVGMLDERDGKASLAGAFGLPQVALR